MLSRQWFALKKGLAVAPGLIKDATPDELIMALVGKNKEKFFDEVSQMKGSFVKAAQMLSMYGEYFMPAEIRDYISKAQASGHYLSWEKLRADIDPEILQKIDISHDPLAAASIGQVHRGKYQNEEVVLKVQYQGIKNAIDLDLKLLKMMVRSLKVLPKGVNLDPIYSEIKENLIREMDYPLEIETQQKFSELLKDDFYYVPKVYPEVSSHNVIVSEYCAGSLLSSPQVRNLPQEKKNHIAKKIFELFFSELFEFNLIQTDAHPGNFLMDLKNDRLVIIDFGSVRSFDQELVDKYKKMIESFYLADEKLFKKTFTTMIEMTGAEVNLDLDDLWDYCHFVSSPIRQASFDWSDKNHADAIYQKAQKMLGKTKVSTPPHQFLFIDRKVVGLFFLMKTLNANFNAQEVVAKFINREDSSFVL